MIEDNPEWQVYKQMMQALYRSSPARTPVAGSVESISHITAQTLYDCHKAFYTPGQYVPGGGRRCGPGDGAGHGKAGAAGGEWGDHPARLWRGGEYRRCLRLCRGTDGGGHAHVPGRLQVPAPARGEAAAPVSPPSASWLVMYSWASPARCMRGCTARADQRLLRRGVRPAARCGLCLCRRRQQGPEGRGRGHSGRGAAAGDRRAWTATITSGSSTPTSARRCGS